MLRLTTIKVNLNLKVSGGGTFKVMGAGLSKLADSF